MTYYAQINEENIVVGISQLWGDVEHPNMIEIDSYDVTLLGKLYTNGEFTTPPRNLTALEAAESLMLDPFAEIHKRLDDIAARLESVRR